MNSEKLEELKRLAEAATPGPWFIDADDDAFTGGSHIASYEHGNGIAGVWPETETENADNNAAYIAAANPAAVLDLIAEVERLREQSEYFRTKSRGHFNAVIGAIEELKAAQDQRDELLAALIGLREDIVGLMSESEGVTGLHLNGDIAPWSELQPCGQYERLAHLADADAAIAKAEAGK